ncbi:hypothetical protein GCM10027565_15980 [Bordetella tumulicola]
MAQPGVQARMERTQAVNAGQRQHSRGGSHGFLLTLGHVHAAVTPQRPVDGQRGSATQPGGHHLIAPRRIVIQVAVGDGIVRLAQIAHDRSAGREQHQKVQIDVLAGQIEVGRPIHLGL